MGFSLEEVEDRLECPHQNSCEYYQVIQEIEAATREGMLTLVKKCQNCQGRDHLMFEVRDYDKSSDVEFSVGDDFTVEDELDWFRRVSQGDRCKVTAIAEHPYRGTDVVSVVGGIEQSPYSATLVEVDMFEKSLSEGEVSFE